LTPAAAPAIVVAMPSTSTNVELLSVEDYRATPEGTRYQLVEGELLMAPAPNRFHQDIVWNLSQILGQFLRGHPVGKAYIAPLDVYLGEHDVFQPDVIFVSNGRRHILADDGAHGAPDLVIEVVSPSSAQLDKKRKRGVYARVGVKELWLVDPILLQIHVYDFARDVAKAVRLVDEDETFECAILPGLTIAAADVFRR
jgi:Uma2 family endonuclease